MIKKQLTAVIVAAIAAVCVAAAATAAPPSCTSSCTTTFTPPTTDAGPFGITSGPLGSEWFANGNAVDRIDQQGNVTLYPVSDPNEQAVGWLTRGPDGAVWFAERDTGKLGRIGANGVMREYDLPSPDAVPQGIVFAPNGDVYVTEQGSNAIARVDPVTGAAVDFPTPTPDSTTQSGVLGPDGAIWFVERSAAQIGRMTLDGHFTEYPLAAGSFPNRMVVGPDGAMWFSELFGGKIGRITTDGKLTEYPIDGGPVGITVGKDGQLYTVLAFAGAVARLDLSGNVTGQWKLPGAVEPLQIATGTGLDLWVTDTFGGGVYRLSPYATGH